MRLLQVGMRLHIWRHYVCESREAVWRGATAKFVEREQELLRETKALQARVDRLEAARQEEAARLGGLIESWAGMLQVRMRQHASLS